MCFTLFDNVSFFVAYQAICIQCSFTILIKELPECTLQKMNHVLNQRNLSDIEQLTSADRQNAKLLKILLLEGEYACNELFETLSSISWKEYELIKNIKKTGDDMATKGSFFSYLRLCLIILFKLFCSFYFTLINFNICMT